MCFVNVSKKDCREARSPSREAENYWCLRSLQGQQVPVCLGAFTPRVAYWYHRELMAQVMILIWSGTRLQHVINDENSSFFDEERKKALAVLLSHGVVHNDSEWRNMLWDDGWSFGSH